MTTPVVAARFGAVMALHAPYCHHCRRPLAECDGTAGAVQHEPFPECNVCVLTETELWPCPTVRALMGLS